MSKKLSYVFRFLGVAAIAYFSFLLVTCEGKPATNTPENRAAHGYVEGQVNEIRLGDALLRFPAGVQFEPSTLHKIVKGKADTIRFGLFYPDLGDNNSTHNSIYIMLKPALPDWTENSAEREKQFNKEQWQKIVYRDDLDLTEYHNVIYRGGWGYITYVAPYPKYQTPIGGKIGYVCTGNPGERIIQCKFSYNGYLQNKKLMVMYIISGENMKDWNEIHQKVVSFLDTIIVE